MSFASAKNYVLQRGIEQLLKEYVTRMVNLSIDPVKKSIRFSVELKGEDGPIEVDVRKYELSERNGKLFLLVHDVSVSKEWLNVVASQVVTGKPIEIDAKSKKIVEVMGMLNIV